MRKSIYLGKGHCYWIEWDWLNTLMLIEPVELNSYDNIISKINKTPYYLMIEKECCENNIDDFIDRLSLLTDIEDRFFLL